MMKLFCCAVVVLSITACGMQEEFFDLADGTDTVLAIGWDGITSKIIAVEPDLGSFRVYDTGVAISPTYGTVRYANNNGLWFLIDEQVYRWDLSKDLTPTLIYTGATAYAFGVSGEGNILYNDSGNVYSITKDGTVSSIGSPEASLAFYQDLFVREESGALFLAQEWNNIYSVSSGSISLYATTLLSPTGRVSFITRVNGEFFIGTSRTTGGEFYRDYNTNGVNFVPAMTSLTVGNDYGISYCVISNTLWYVAYQSASDADIIVERYENGVQSTVASIPTTGTAYVYLRHYKDDRFILGVSGGASAQGLYVVDAGNNSYSLISSTYSIYGLSRADE